MAKPLIGTAGLVWAVGVSPLAVAGGPDAPVQASPQRGIIDGRTRP